MRYFAIYNLVGIAVSDNYPWMDTLFVAQGVAAEGETVYTNCRAKIQIYFEKTISKDGTRDIGDGANIGQNIYVDESYGVRLEKTEEKLDLYVSQECNEWLVIAVQLALLECGYTMIHAAAVEKNGKVLLLPSWGGVGKTATVCRFIREYGWKLLGDDLVILGEGKVLPFLKPFVIYPYHKDLFPELFANNENHTVKNLTISKMMGKAIPTVKRMLRPFPAVLAYLRKHNPQSMRVSPNRIFTPDQLSVGGELLRMVWLERSVGENVVYGNISSKALASKAATVSCVELFAAKLDSVYHLCGCGMLNYEEVFGRMYDIILSAAEKNPCAMLEIPTSVNITDVGQVIYDQLKADNEE